MNLRPPLAFAALVALGCQGNPENSAACGFASIAAASLVMQSLQDVGHAVGSVPPDIPRLLPAKVVGRGTTPATSTGGPGGLTITYQGEGFPKLPGFGLLLVDDSLEVVRGILVYEPEAPPGFPKLGTITDGRTTLPLVGARVHWPSLNAPRCPMFQPLGPDTARR